MNAIDIFTMNKHADYPEVVFSSILSYILNPKIDHKWDDACLRVIGTKIFPNIENWNSATLRSEFCLNNRCGCIDILIEHPDAVLGIEVKIWDRSARNNDKNDISQLMRYCSAFSQKYKKKAWKIIYVIPDIDSKECINEFKKGALEYKDNLSLLPWNSPEPESFKKLNEDLPGVLDCSVLSILETVSLSSENSTEISRWIFRSFMEKIPYLIVPASDPGRFPLMADLENSDLSKKYRSFFNYFKRYPNAKHTVVGIPYGHDEFRSNYHSNCLFRIRVTKKYYAKDSEKIENMPSGYLEIELWPEVYDMNKNGIDSVIGKLNGVETLARNVFHIDRYNNVPIVLVRIPGESEITEQWIEEFEMQVKKGFILSIS